MAQEEMKGPQELRKKEGDDGEEEKNDAPVDEEDEAYKEKLREYQLNRLKYFYAVIEFDSVKCADIVYKECDGLEYESTANRLDLRFVPDDMDFDDEPKDVCTELPSRGYQPRIFFTTALQQAKVELTWDETDVSRKEISEKLFSDKRSEITDLDLRKFVAFSSSEGEHSDRSSEPEDASEASDDEDKPKDKISLYKNLLQEINQKEDDKKKKQIEMEFSWSVGSDKKVVEDETESEKEELTPFEKILEKKKQKKKAKKDARKKKVKGGGDEDDKNGYSSSDFDDIDMNDPYFAEEFANGDFAMPKKSSKNKKNKKKAKLDESDEEEKLKAQKELELLVDDSDDDKAHFSLKKIQDSETMSMSKRKRKLKKSKKDAQSEPVDNFEINLKDDRFSAVYSKPDFNIDPTDPGFKKTKGMEVLIQEKLKRRYNDDDGATTSSQPADKKPKTRDVSLNMLVKSIKRKVGK